jgi:hypothetical protein
MEMKTIGITSWNRAVGPIALAMLLVASCSTRTGQMAGKGAVGGAAAGAVGGLVSALVFGGDPAEAAARGAVYGGSVGAASGAVAGAQMDHAAKEQRDARLEKLKKEIGQDAFSGLEALADCKHEVALGHARTAAQSDNKDHALAGLWLEVLSYGDSRQESQARALFPDLIAKDDQVRSEAQAEETMRKALLALMDIREQYKMPRVCQ